MNLKNEKKKTHAAKSAVSLLDNIKFLLLFSEVFFPLTALGIPLKSKQVLTTSEAEHFRKGV